MKKLKVATVVGTRPELIKLSCVIPSLDESFEHVLIHTGQNYDYELNQIFFDQLEIRRPDEYLGAAGGSACSTIAKVIESADSAFARHVPDAILIYGDTNSSLSVIAAKKRRIPVFHMEAGNRCFDERVPEEVNRRLVDHLSDINMPLTEHARGYLIREGIRAETVIKTGSCMPEVLKRYETIVDQSQALREHEVDSNGFILLSAHREENVDDPVRLRSLVDCIRNVAKEYGKTILFSVHPRTRMRLESLGSVDWGDTVRPMAPLGFPDYVRLQREAFCVLSDSGTLTEEAATIGFPAVTIRQAHERPEGMDEGVLVMSDLDSERLISAISIVASSRRAGNRLRIPDDYRYSEVSRKVVSIIASYTDYVLRTVWRRYA